MRAVVVGDREVHDDCGDRVTAGTSCWVSKLESSRARMVEQAPVRLEPPTSWRGHHCANSTLASCSRETSETTTPRRRANGTVSARNWERTRRRAPVPNRRRGTRADAFATSPTRDCVPRPEVSRPQGTASRTARFHRGSPSAARAHKRARGRALRADAAIAPDTTSVPGAIGSRAG